MIQFLTQDKDFFPPSLSEKFIYTKQIGFDGFEIDGKLLLEQFSEVQKAVEKSGFPILTACGGYQGWIGDFDQAKRAKCLKDISLILERLSQLNGKGIVVPAAWGMFSLRLPPMKPPRTSAEDEKVLFHSLEYLNEVAAKNKVTLFLEPLNRYEDHMINTLDKARYYIEKGGFSSVSITADFYHMNIEEARIEESLILNQKFIGHVHLADNHRYQPGSGHTDFINAFSALNKAGYNGAFAFECRVIGDNPETEYIKSLQYIKNCYKRAIQKVKKII